MTALQSETLILTSNATSVKQWKEELLKRTTLKSEHVGEYTGADKQVRPVTISTYQMMTYRQQKDGEWSHMRLVHERDWGSSFTMRSICCRRRCSGRRRICRRRGASA